MEHRSKHLTHDIIIQHVRATLSRCVSALLQQKMKVKKDRGMIKEGGKVAIYDTHHKVATL